MSRIRRTLVKKLVKEGREAWAAGRHHQANPYKYQDAFQWSKGWWLAANEAKEAAA